MDLRRPSAFVSLRGCTGRNVAMRLLLLMDVFYHTIIFSSPCFTYSSSLDYNSRFANEVSLQDGRA
jgi:hypothetical protein